MKVFHDSLFCIHLQRQYSAARELDEFLSTAKVDPKNITDPNIAKHYQALKGDATTSGSLTTNCHIVIWAIFKDKEALMRQVPHTYLAELVDLIMIVKSLMSPGRLQKVACFFVPIDHPDYAE
eukprot:gene42476-51889_t